MCQTKTSTRHICRRHDPVQTDVSVIPPAMMRDWGTIVFKAVNVSECPSEVYARREARDTSLWTTAGSLVEAHYHESARQLAPTVTAAQHEHCLCQGHTRQTVLCHHAYVCLSWLMVICQSRPHYISVNQTTACQNRM